MLKAAEMLKRNCKRFAVTIAAVLIAVQSANGTTPTTERDKFIEKTEQAFRLALSEAAKRKKNDKKLNFRMTMITEEKAWLFSFHFLPLSPGDDVLIKVYDAGVVSAHGGF